MRTFVVLATFSLSFVTLAGIAQAAPSKCDKLLKESVNQCVERLLKGPVGIASALGGCDVDFANDESCSSVEEVVTSYKKAMSKKLKADLPEPVKTQQHGFSTYQNSIVTSNGSLFFTLSVTDMSPSFRWNYLKIMAVAK